MHGVIKPDATSTDSPRGDRLDPPVEIVRPSTLAAPVVFASPHSGRAYTEDFVAASRLDALTLRASEDAYVDELFGDAPHLGAPLIAARFPRAYVDANRDPWELDPAMFADPLPTRAKTRTARVAAGLGCVPRIVADGAEIYSGLMPFREAERRIRHLHQPYHRELDFLLIEAKANFGAAVLIDCHSMPSVGGGRGGPGGADIVIGDRHGASSTPAVTDFVESQLRALGYAVARNAPYAGGWSTERYGRPARGVSAIQIEINRALYLNEKDVSHGPGFNELKHNLSKLMEAVIAFAAEEAPSRPGCFDVRQEKKGPRLRAAQL